MFYFSGINYNILACRFQTEQTGTFEIPAVLRLPPCAEPGSISEAKCKLRG
jgi:hypothetical protein